LTNISAAKRSSLIRLSVSQIKTRREPITTPQVSSCQHSRQSSPGCVFSRYSCPGSPSTRYFRPTDGSLKPLIAYAPGTHDPLNPSTSSSGSTTFIQSSIRPTVLHNNDVTEDRTYERHCTDIYHDRPSVLPISDTARDIETRFHNT
jgi:hypothetical protein